jgi:hydrogenase 3 maturation protease
MSSRTPPLDFPVPRPDRVAVIGVGNVMNADDGAGVLAVEALAARVPASPHLLVLGCGTAPENFTGPLRRFRPDLVVEIDAAHLGEAPGAVAWVDWHEADGMSASTHTLPPSVLARFLSTDLGCRVALIGIQPATLEMGQGVSPDVAAAIDRLADQMVAWLTGIRS